MYDKHAKIALKFSGGKDSLACLELLRPIMDRVTVFWMNTGAAPEGYADYIRSMVPDVVEVLSDQPRYIREVGIPSDIVPIGNTPFAAQFKPVDVKIVAWSSCCNQNMWQPLHNACLHSGATAIVTGQRNDDIRKNPVQNGQVLDGVEYIYPLLDWSEDDVISFLIGRGIEIPSFYDESETSPDCWDCTAFMDERMRELKTMKARYPERWSVVKPRLEAIKHATQCALAHIDARLEG